MKRLLVAVCLLACLLTATSCGIQSRQDRVLESLGTPADKMFHTHGSFQDYTDFGVYTYTSLSLEQNKYFVPLSEAEQEKVLEYLDDYEKWIDLYRQSDPSDALAANYTFDRGVIDIGDFYYLYEEEGNKFSDYDLWIADSQTKTVYYFHNNI